MPDTCDEGDCSRDVHENVNGIQFNKCTKHFLKTVSDFR